MGLRSIGFLLDVRIGNNVPTFNTADLTSLMFVLRDSVGDQPTVCAQARGRLIAMDCGGLS